jgi:hypothetical protein
MLLKELQHSHSYLSKSNIKIVLDGIVLEMYPLLIKYTLMVCCFEGTI